MVEHNKLEKIKDKLIQDFKSFGISVDFNLVLRGYSSTHYGKYNPNTNTIVIYVEDENGKLFPYKKILRIGIHEVVHCIQWHDPSFIRFKGVMHNSQFYKLLNNYYSKLDKQY